MVNITNKLLYIVEVHKGSHSIFLGKARINDFVSGHFKFEYRTIRKFYTTKKEALAEAKKFNVKGWSIYDKT